MGELWAKALEFVERRAWIVAAALAFILFIPDEAAQQVGTKQIRDQWQGYLWVAFLVTILLALAGFFTYVDKRVGGWFAIRNEQRKEANEKQKIEERLKLRLSSLNGNEYGLVAMCLQRMSQSFSAKAGHTAAESLSNKGLVRGGSGTVFDRAYHFTDEAWRYLLEHKEEFYPEGADADPQMQSLIRETVESLHDQF